MHKKPFHSDNRSERKSFGNNEDKPFRKSSDKKEDRSSRKPSGDRDDKPFRKSFGNNEDKPFRKSFDKKGDAPFRKSFGDKEDKPFRKSSGDREDKPFRKSFDNKEDKPFRKSFGDKEDKPFRKSSGDREDKPFRKFFDKKEDKPFRKSFGDKEDKPFRKSSGDREDKPFRKSFDNKEDRPFRKSSGDREDRPFKKSFDKKGDAPFRKSFGDKEDKPFRKSFGDKEDRPFKKSFGNRKDKPFRKSSGDREDKPFRKSSGDREDRPFKKPYGKQDEKPFKKFADKDKEDKKPNRYANTFGKLDDEELAAHNKKQQEKKEQREQQEEVTFSKELDKWEEEPRERDFGKSDVKAGKKKEIDETTGKIRHRHDAQSRFKKQFDNEHDYERAYEAAPGKKEETASHVADLDGQLMPLNKFIAHCDVCSRRDAVTLIKEGKVTVNGELITEPGHKVTSEDSITLNGTKLVIQKNLIYILMNKPKGFITTTDDPKGRRTVMEMVENVIEERVFPVGRLDRNTTGLLLLTNDGELTQKLSHPKHGIRKVYKATLDKNLAKADFEKIKEGVVLEDGKADVDQLEYLENKNEIGLEIHSGKNRIVRRIFESLGYEVEKLDRVMYAGLTKKNILRGKWRLLTKQEVINLKHML